MASPAEAVLAASVAVSLSPSAVAAAASVAAGWSCHHPWLLPEGSGEPGVVAVSLEHFDWFSGSWLKWNKRSVLKKLAEEKDIYSKATGDIQCSLFCSKTGNNLKIHQ